MKETEKIIEMAKKMTDENKTDVAEALSHLFVSLAECLYDDGYRKQSEGTWEKRDIPGEKYVCSECGGACWYYDFEGDVAKSKFCPNCGAKMKGGAE